MFEEQQQVLAIVFKECLVVGCKAVVCSREDLGSCQPSDWGGTGSSLRSLSTQIILSFCEFIYFVTSAEMDRESVLYPEAKLDVPDGFLPLWGIL